MRFGADSSGLSLEPEPMCRRAHARVLWTRVAPACSEVRDDVVDQLRPVCEIRRAPHDGPNPHAAEGQQFVVAALAAVKTGSRASRMPHSRKASNSSMTKRGNSDPVLTPVRAMKLPACCCTRRYNMCLLRSMALVVDLGAIGRPLGLLADGLQARVPNWCARTVPSRALHLNCPAVSRPKCNSRVIELRAQLDESRPGFERRPATA